MGLGVGIDLGTTNTVVAVVRDGQPVTLADEGGRKLIPSFVSFHPSGKVLVGESAKDRRVVDPENTIYSVKRLIGRTFAADEVQRARRAMQFELVEGEKQGIRVVARGEIYTLPEISAFVLRRAKAVAEAALGEVVDKAVITVPANFNDPQRAATKLAGKLAGLEVLRILNEPTAAALAYGQSTGTPERIAVYDLGGGTFDVTLLDLSGSVFEVLATGGDSALGGDDVDQLIVTEMTNFFLQKFRFDPRVDPSARATLRSRAEKLKHALSEREESSIELNDVVRGEGGAFLPATFSMERKKLEDLVKPLIDRTVETCRFSIETIGLSAQEIDRVLLVGGATRMPIVARHVEEYFQRPTAARVNPDEVVAMGAAVQAAALTKGHTRGRLMQPTVPKGFAVPGRAPGIPSHVAHGDGHAKGDKPPESGRTIPFGSVAVVLEEVAPDEPGHTLPFSPSVAAVKSAAAAPPRPRGPTPPNRLPPPPPRTATKGPPPMPPRPNVPRPAPQAAATPASAELEAALREFLVEAPKLESEAPEAPPLLELPVLDPDVHGIPSDTPAATRDSDVPVLDPDVHGIPSDIPVLDPDVHGIVSEPPLSLSGLHTSQSEPPVLEPLSLPPESLPPVSFDFDLPVRPPTRSSRPPQPAPFLEDATMPADYGLPPPEPRPAVAPEHSFRAAPLLIDVTPISLGVEVAGGFCEFLIAANTPVPCDRTRVFRTASDGQTAVRVRVVQGESERFSENTYLGDLELSGLRSAPRGEVAIGVTFEIDADGILNVRAKEEASGRETVARMNLLGAQTDTDEVAAMMARQRRHDVA